MINFSKYRRFFAFGCSMTRYYWPTWADIVSQHIPEYYNYARSGAGNLFISNQITEAHQRYKFNETDLIMVMWTSIHREDRYLNRHWQTPGNIYTQLIYSEDFVKKFSDPRGYLIRDLALITLSTKLLESTKSDFYMLNMMPFGTGHSKEESRIISNDVLELYKDTIDKIYPDIYTIEYNQLWPEIPIKGPNNQTADYHPDTKGHSNYLKKIFPGIEFSDKAETFINTHQSYIENAEQIEDLKTTWQLPWPLRF